MGSHSFPYTDYIFQATNDGISDALNVNFFNAFSSPSETWSGNSTLVIGVAGTFV